MSESKVVENSDVDTSYLGNLLRGLQSIPETAYDYLKNTSYSQMGSDALDLGKNVYHDITEHPIENLLGALPIVGSGMAAHEAYKLNDRIKQAYASGNHEDAKKLERALVLSSLGAIPIFGELSSVGSSAARMAEEAMLHGAAETGSRAIANSIPRDAYQVAENMASHKINQALDSAKKRMFADVNDERKAHHNIDREEGGRIMGNNAIDNAIRMARGGNAGDGINEHSILDTEPPIEVPHSLQELQNWNKTHPRPLNKHAMDDIFSLRLSGVEGAEPIAMPASLDELLADLRRRHHASGGRLHYEDGGETDGGDPRGNEAGMSDRSQSDGLSSDPRGDERGFADVSQPDNIASDVGRFSFGRDFDVSGDNYTGHEMPTGLIGYSEKRMNTPYEGSLLSATMDPSNAFGMGYGSLVGKANTRAGAAGFLGSAMGESGKELDPSAINAGSIGVFQHTGPRATDLRDVLGIGQTVSGNELRDALAGSQMPQLGFALNEVATKPDYTSTRNAMRTGTNAADVADVALENFERPSLENQIKSAPSREAYALGIMAGRPSGATLGVGQYDGTPSSIRDALKSGVDLAKTQRGRFGASNDYASNDANALVGSYDNSTVSGGTADDTLENTIPRIPVDSLEDPALIAAYNAQYGLSGPKNAFADMTLGQRVPNVTTNNPFINKAQQFGNFLTDKLTPSYNLNSPEYNKISEAVYNNREQSPDYRNDHTQQVIDNALAVAAPAAPVAPYTTQLSAGSLKLPSTTGQTAQQWAAQNVGGDMSKVNARIKYINGAPRLEYYTA